MSERVRIETGHRTFLCLLTSAVFAFLPLSAYGQCKEPPNPKTAVAAPRIGAAVAGAAQARTANAATEFGKPAKPAPPKQGVPMMYKPQFIDVPDLSNKTIDQVKAEVANILTMRTVNNNNPGWIVRRQFPETNSRVQICSPLDLWMVEPVPQMTRVPPIVGVPETKIPGLLEKFHLKYAGSRPKDSNEPVGTVVDQDPKPGTPEPWSYGVIAYKAVGPPPQIEPTPTVHLTADATSIKPGETVRFVAKLEPNSPGAQFFFDFGDGQSTTQEDPEVPHQFVADRDYEVTVTAKLAKQQVQSEPLRITVHSTKYTLDLTWTPLHPAAGQPVVFTATLDPPNPAIGKGPYFFSFGDKSKLLKLESPKNIYTRSFARPGPYPVRVWLNGEHGHIIESVPAELFVVVPPPPLHPPSWWERSGKSAVAAGAIVLVAFFVGLYGTSKYLTGLVAFRVMGKIGSVHLHQPGNAGLEAAFGFRLERPTVTAAESHSPIVAKVERIQ